MSKRYKNAPVNFLDFLDTKERENTLPITVGDKTFHLYSREHLSEAQFQALMATEETAEGSIETCRILLDDYDGFIAAGGTTAGLLTIIEDRASGTLAEQGVSVGESGASSDS